MHVNGRKAMPTSGSRTEFLSVDALGSANDIKYGRTGGWFVSKRKAMSMAFLVVLALIIVGLLVHYLSSCKSKTEEKGTVTDGSVVIPKIVPTEVPESKVEEFLLPKDVTPSHYKLQLEPYLEKPDPRGRNFSYEGHVTITIVCHEASSKVTFHAKNLTLGNITIAPSDTSATTAATNTVAPTENATVTTTSNLSNVTVAATTNVTNETSPERPKRSIRSNRWHRSQRSTATPAPTTFAPGTPPQITDRVGNTEKDTVTLNLKPGLEKGRTYVLDISFNGSLRDSLYGFYRSRYKNADGTTVWMATTQFEAPHAREAFPCFDQPDMKATFEISISRGVDMATVSNMPIRVTEPVKGQTGRVWDHYEASPVMSTYLVAFIVTHSDFVPTNVSTPGNGTKGPDFRVFARKQLIEQAEYAASIGPKILQFYGDYFGIPYPLPKMDMAAIPDFAAGAMENWGLITYRETDLLVDPKSTSTKQKDRVALVVAHELAHQWFGNLVTMKWWNDLWLNEGFATYMEYVGADHVEPTWAMLDKMYVYEQQRALELDSLNSTHPVSTRVADPSQISELFDRVSYSKGASLIQMLNNSITEDVLRKGLSRYLNKWKYNNAEENDLWEALTAQVRESKASILPANVTVKQVMDTWTLQDGYPVLTVSRDYNDSSATLSQRRFTLDNSTSDTLWFIPVSYATQEEMSNATNSSRRTLPRLWLKKEITTKISNLAKNDSWVLFNIYASGYYRVNYDTRNWELLASYLQNAPPGSELPAVTRAQLLDDAFYLARAGLLDYDVALNLTRYVATKENLYVPMSSFLGSMAFLENMLRETKDYGLFQEYMLKTLQFLKTSLGFEPATNEPQLTTILRPLVVKWLTVMGDPEAVAWAMNLFKQWTNSSDPDYENPIPVDLRSTVYCTAVKMGGREEYDFIMKRYQLAEKSPSEAVILLSSLVCTREEWLTISLLDMSLETGGPIRLQDAYRVWGSASNTASSSRIAFNYVRNNWDYIYDKYGMNEFLLGAVLVGSISGLTTQLDMHDVQEFYTKNEGKFAYVQRTMSQEMEGLQLKVTWHDNHYETISSWLHKFHQDQSIRH